MFRSFRKICPERVENEMKKSEKKSWNSRSWTIQLKWICKKPILKLKLFEWSRNTLLLEFNQYIHTLKQIVFQIISFGFSKMKNVKNYLFAKHKEASSDDLWNLQREKCKQSVWRNSQRSINPLAVHYIGVLKL